MSPTPSQFDGVAGDLRSWRRNANWLKASADVVFKLWSDEMIRPFDNPTGPEIVPAEVGFVAMMLAGLALENLAKALVIAVSRVSAPSRATRCFSIRRSSASERFRAFAWTYRSAACVSVVGLAFVVSFARMRLANSVRASSSVQSAENFRSCLPFAWSV